jgi:hypothetical protein
MVIAHFDAPYPEPWNTNPDFYNSRLRTHRWKERPALSRDVRFR